MGKIAQLENGQKISSQFPDSHLILVLLIFVSQIDPILLSMPPTDYLLCILEKFSRNFAKHSLAMNINTITFLSGNTMPKYPIDWAIVSYGRSKKW